MPSMSNEKPEEQIAHLIWVCDEYTNRLNDPDMICIMEVESLVMKKKLTL